MSQTQQFYESVATGEDLNPRLELFLERYRRHRSELGRPVDVLDVGCGEHAVLHRYIDSADTYHGTDVKKDISAPLEHYRAVDLNEESLADAWDGRRFDVIFCGEVLEHVFSPDRLLRELKSVMGPDSLLILSTPNLAYWVNRLLLPLGITPLFVENSAEVKLGRRFRFLGQGNETQGHVRLFTHVAALELIEREGFELVGTEAVPVWPLPIDKLVCRYSNRLAPVNVYFLRLPRA